MQRRLFLKSSGLAMFAAGSGVLPGFVQAAASAVSSSHGTKTLVVIFQRFGMDGLMAVTPYADQHLARLRPDLMLSPPGSGKDNARIDLDGKFGLHPSMAPLAPLFQDGELAIIHGSGSPHNTRSHTEAQLWWESGAPGDRSVDDGWLNRALAQVPSSDLPLQAVALGNERPRALYGELPVSTIANLEGLSLALPNASHATQVSQQLRKLYSQHGNEILKRAGLNGLEIAQLVRHAGASEQSNIAYPQGSAFGNSLREIARLIKADMGLQLAFAESQSTPDGRGSWDSHSDQASLSGPMAAVAGDFAHSIAAFWKDLGERREDVVLVTMTDFGRNVVQNAGVGTDHGRATATFVLGGNILGGHVYGELPERFDRDALEDQMDLPVTTDFRSIMSALTESQLGIKDHQRVFPGWRGNTFPIVRA